jgi:phosphate transport system permease protein
VKASGGFSGYKRRHRTRLRVRLADSLSRWMIGIGGIGTIVAVIGVCVFLAATVLPLFARPETGSPEQERLATPAAPARFAVDEYRVLGWTLDRAGRLRVFRLDDGTTLQERGLGAEVAVTACSFGISENTVILGYADGSVRSGSIDFTARMLDDAKVPAEHRGLAEGQVAALGDSMVMTRTPGGFRAHEVRVHLEPPVVISAGRPVVLVDRADRLDATVLAALTDDRQVHVREVHRRENLITGEMTTRVTGGDFALPAGAAMPAHLLMSRTGQTLWLAWEDGRAVRYDSREMARPVPVEEIDLVPEPGARLSALQFLLGRGTILAGDSRGSLRTWFMVRADPRDGPADGWRTVNAHLLEGSGAALTCLASSKRTRIAAAGYADGRARLFHVTSRNRLAEVRTDPAENVLAVVFSPKEDGLLALTPRALWRWDIDVNHPEAGFTALFLPVWYEGAPRPEHVWQSSSGDDAFEPKLGMMPLIFGTLKATFYSLIFGVPLALLAAVYTSEFLHPRVRGAVKPAVELMASLPSVVLGFLAALVIAPVAERIVPEVLTAFVTIPLALLLSAHLWQLLPSRAALRLERFRLLLVLPALAAGAGAAALAGRGVERVLFSGDIRAWLDGQVGTGTGGWLILFLPLCAAAAAAANVLVVSPRLRPVIAPRGPLAAGLIDLGRFAASAAGALLLALGLSWAVSALGFDPRGGGSFLGTYVQRNALVVGFIMGFAIVPIVYTIAEDALSSVPDHLRAASLGAGATPWQTAARIVVPTAMSGLFSAVMIGLGRAVGETMIVLMAGGNTPITEWNVFNGMRTLSANIAVEMPEAPQGGTLYRTLFLAGLVLFAMTFIINTAAEVVRLRFRKKAYQL